MRNELSELTDTELDAVCGGILNLGDIVTQVNNATAVGVALNIGTLASLANVTQSITQANFSF